MSLPLQEKTQLYDLCRSIHTTCLLKASVTKVGSSVVANCILETILHQINGLFGNRAELSWGLGKARYFLRLVVKEMSIVMKLRVTTRADLTQGQREALQRLGCEATPYISWSHALVFAATCSREQEQALRRLMYVANVEPMPMYGPA